MEAQYLKHCTTRTLVLTLTTSWARSFIKSIFLIVFGVGMSSTFHYIGSRLAFGEKQKSLVGALEAIDDTENVLLPTCVGGLKKRHDMDRSDAWVKWHLVARHAAEPQGFAKRMATLYDEAVQGSHISSGVKKKEPRPRPRSHAACSTLSAPPYGLGANTQPPAAPSGGFEVESSNTVPPPSITTRRFPRQMNPLEVSVAFHDERQLPRSSALILYKNERVSLR